MPREFWQFPQSRQGFFHQQQGGKQQTPQHEIPGRSVPQTREHPHHQDVAHPLAPADPVAPKGDIHIVPEPASQRNMPPPPEFRDAFGQIGVVEIFREMEAEHPPQADGHVGIPGKIEIDVQGKGNGVKPGEHHGRSRAFPIELYKHRQIVCQNDLFRKAHEKPPQTLPHSFPAVRPAVQLPRHVPIADDRPGNELGKQGDVGTEGNGVFLGRNCAPVHVHGVADTLEGIEADAHGQSQLQKRN